MTDNEAAFLQATQDHIRTVHEHMYTVIHGLMDRAESHDDSKLEEPEFSLFAEHVQPLEELEYGSEEYYAHLEESEIDKALEHHYQNNSHHPEHHEDGVSGMDLLDVVEMFCDWLAAVERHDDGNDIFDSIEENAKRFDLDDQLVDILTNTADRFYEPQD